MQIFQALRLRSQTSMPPAAGGFAPGPLAYSGLGLCPQTPKLPYIATFWIHAWQLCTVYNYLRFLSFCFEQILLDHSIANLMMLTLNERQMLNYFLLQRFI